MRALKSNNLKPAPKTVKNNIETSISNNNMNGDNSDLKNKPNDKTLDQININNFKDLINISSMNIKENEKQNKIDINEFTLIKDNNAPFNFAYSHLNEAGNFNNKSLKDNINGIQKTKYHVIEPRDYQKKIFEEIKDKNAIVFLETGKGKTFISIMLMKYIYGFDINRRYDVLNKLPMGKKTVFLVCEVVLVEQQSMVIKQNTPFRVKACSGKNMKSMKKDYKTFRLNWENFDIFVATPQVIYLLLTTGYLKISDIDLLIFDECHHADANHPYNLLMIEFYFYYLTNSNCIGKTVKLPQILGLTASPLKKKIDKDILSSAQKALVQICENLDSVIVIDPEVKGYELKTGEDGISNLSSDDANREYIEIEKHTNHPNFDDLINFLKENLFIPLTNLCFNKIQDEDAKMLREDYDNYIKEKYESVDLTEFNKVLSRYKYLYEMRKTSGLFSMFEKIQRHLFMVLENLNLESLRDMLEDYVIHLENLSISKEATLEFSDLISENISDFIQILRSCLRKMKMSFESKRLEELRQRVLNIIQEDMEAPNGEGHRIIIFVSNRIVAELLSKIINIELANLNKEKKRFQAVAVVGVNNRKSENALNPKNSVTQMNENIELFKNGSAQILIGTSTIEEGLDVRACDVVMVYTDLRTAKSYIQMKGRARRANAKFLVFTPNKTKTMQNIEDFVELTLCMRDLFEDGIVKDFRGKDFLAKKELDYKFYEIPENFAKITLKNVSVLYNEFFQVLKNNKKAKKIENKITFSEEREFRGNGMTTVFRAKFTFNLQYESLSIPTNLKMIESPTYIDKASAENYCYVVFFQICHQNKFVDNNFKIALK